MKLEQMLSEKPPHDCAGPPDDRALCAACVWEKVARLLSERVRGADAAASGSALPEPPAS